MGITMKSIKPGRGPSMMSGVASIGAAIFGLIWTIAAASMGAGPFALFGLVFIGIVSGLGGGGLLIGVGKGEDQGHACRGSKAEAGSHHAVAPGGEHDCGNTVDRRVPNRRALLLQGGLDRGDVAIHHLGVHNRLFFLIALKHQDRAALHGFLGDLLVLELIGHKHLQPGRRDIAEHALNIGGFRFMIGPVNRHGIGSLGKSRGSQHQAQRHHHSKQFLHLGSSSIFFRSSGLCLTRNRPGLSGSRPHLPDPPSGALFSGRH